MTAQILAAELGTLIQDSKRKNTELRNAAEKALQDLKSLANTSEAQLSADLSRRPHFISPFLIACATHNAKFASTGVSCLQRLSVSRALPRERLIEVLDAFKESIASSHDIQLKILQSLPSLLQNYPVEIRGEPLSTVFHICSGLQNAKNFAVSNTAAATLQQLVITVFDRVVSEDDKALQIPVVTEVEGDDGLVPVRPAADDAYKMFNDLNLLITGEKPVFIRFAPIPATSTLELIEAILSNHGRIMTTHAEQIYLLRSLLMPVIIRSLSDRLSFPTTVRVIRILNLIIRNHLEILPSECEIALGLLNHMLDPEASQLWKRALCLEMFRGIYADSRLLLAIYSHFDATEGKKCIFGDNLAAFVRLAIEKPALIGLGQQSTMPTRFGDSKDIVSEQAAAEAGALAGVIGGPVGETSSGNRPFGISTQWSSLKTPCMDHLDKSDPPALPDTYIYSLVLTCITNISEALAKFVLPLTVHHETKSKKKNKADDHDTDMVSSDLNNHSLSRTQSFRKKTVPVNPLDLTDHSAYTYVQTSSTLVTDCWPAVLATCSTFLNAALDTDYYRALVRAIQKFTQVAGLLRLSTPRDAFLTTLGKAAVPSNMLLANVSSPKTAEPTGMFSNAKGLLSVDSLVSQASSSTPEKNRQEMNIPALGPRNLLCLRALLNLAIALGPTLQSAWSIIFETLQVADLVMALSSQSGVGAPGMTANRVDSTGSSEKMDAETSAVQAAARRLFESTVDFPNESFTEVLQALCALLHSFTPAESGQRTPVTSGRPKLHQRKLGSLSGISLNTKTHSRDSAFALNKIGELAAFNEARLSQFDPIDSGWNVLVTEIVRCSTDNREATSTRLLAADILSRTVRNIAELSMSDEQREDIQARILRALQNQISTLHRSNDDNDDVFSDTDIRVHQITLEALKGVIEQCGESLVAGWGSVFDSLMSVFFLEEPSTTSEHKKKDAMTDNPHLQLRKVEVISRSLARSAFATVHLVCSDFMAAVPDAHLSTLLELLLWFCSQQEDLNMSLTAITFFWNVSDFLQSRSDLSSLPKILGDVEKHEKVYNVIASQSREGSIPALWLQVLLNLSSITTDKRAELRSSAIQTIQRIFGNYSEQLSSDGWMFCIRIVVFGTVEANLQVHDDVRDAHSTAGDLQSWNDTTKTILQSVSVLSTMCMEKLGDASKFGEIWSDLLDYLQRYFQCGSHALGTSVFITISGVLSHLDNAQMLGMPPLLKTAQVWKRYFNYRDTWKDRQEGNQDAYIAYADAFKAIYRLAGQALDADLPSMLSNLEACIVDSDQDNYSSDVEHMTTLQTRVMECLSSVQTESSGLPSYLIKLLGRFSVLPYTSPVENSEKRRPTFVALSKAAMTLLQKTTIEHVNKKDVFDSGAFYSALSSLAKPIEEKYSWQREGKPPTIWQKATTAAIAILDVGLPKLEAHDLTSASLQDIWSTLVNIAHFITRAQLAPGQIPPISLEKDETFDIQSFKQLRDLITLSLGSASLDDDLRRTYARNLFSTSLIHSPFPGELPDLLSAPLEDLYKIRLGQTAKLESTLRIEMNYECLSELFSLVAVHDSSASRVKLAQAAAPYLILRAALPLRTYIADHPLRGRMPAPQSQRHELLFVLAELSKLKSEPQAIPDAPGVKSKYRKHLHRLYPLLLKAMRVTRQDPEVFEELARLTDLVGDEFGLEDD